MKNESKEGPRGAGLLRHYLSAKKIKAPTFCRRFGLDANHINKILRGDRKRISVDLALDIQEATRGEVPVESWRLPGRLSKTSVKKMDKAA